VDAGARLPRAPRPLIREALRDEAETLAAIQRDASLAANAHIFPPELYPFPMAEIIGRWERFLDDPSVSVLVCEEDGTGVGVAGSRAGWLDGLYVLPEWWSRGVGRSLHDEVLERQRRAGGTRCHLWVLERNDRARRFYERLGWHENRDTRVVPFPPNPIDVGYSIEL
jgi:GNAT superfamily N-acetyltransferase